MKRNILAIGAHPDDLELSMGGTIYKLSRASSDIICYHTTNGVYTDIYEEPVREYKEIIDSTTKSLSLLGVKPENIFFNQDTNATELKVNKKIISDIQKIIIDNNITDIYTHMEKDTYHQDHIATHLITMAAARRYINNIYFFECVFNFEELVPNSYVDVTDCIDLKCDALRMHKIEYDKFNGEEWIESVKSLANYRGMQIGVKYAESFSVKKQLRKIS